MAPISHAINKMKLGFTSSAGGRLDADKFHQSHLFYMDDLKVYSNSADNLERILEKIHRISQAISMVVNAKKCARASHEPHNAQVQIGSPIGRTPSSEATQDIRSLSVGETYKYLGIEQRLAIEPGQAWDRAKSKFIGTVELVWDSDLTFGQKASFTNSIISMMTYVTRNSFKSGGTFRSTLKRADDLDLSMRKLLNKLKARYKASSVARLYLPRRQGGYGLTSVRDSVADSTIYAWAYVCTRVELRKQLALFQALARRTKRSVISDANFVLEETGCVAYVDSLRSAVLFNETEYTEPRELARAVVSSMRNMRNAERYSTWKNLVAAGKVLHSKLDLQVLVRYLEQEMKRIMELEESLELAGGESNKLATAIIARIEEKMDGINQAKENQVVVRNCPTRFSMNECTG
ncbi:uncharacterized protein LOC143869086 [Tasmannia lanceolata]|uniref:uncharacterized protein LOC143869086 n=1 Tax=Tasmannia lanceolata TaxID=3420 RepID=UPI0040633779